jgi:small-conductance mechanosensitive channel
MDKTKDKAMLDKCAFLLNIQVTSEKLLMKKRWMFNKGEIRDIQEWDNYKPRKYKMYYTPPYYIPICIAIVIIFILALKDSSLVLLSLAIIPLVTLWISVLIYYIGSARYLDFLTKQKEVSPKELDFAVKQLKKAKAAVVATVIASASIARSAKNAQKELDNPSKWKKI